MAKTPGVLRTSLLKGNEAKSADFQADPLACRGDVIMLVLQRNRCSDQINRILIQPDLINLIRPRLPYAICVNSRSRRNTFF